LNKIYLAKTAKMHATYATTISTKEKVQSEGL